MADVSATTPDPARAQNAGVFAGKIFFVVQLLPCRQSYLKSIQDNGGRVVKVEDKADYIIADHLRRDCPVNSISYTFIDAAIAEGSLPDPADHACEAGSGPARAVGSVVASAKKTKNLFTTKEDNILIAHLARTVRAGKPVKGNVPFREMAAEHPNHTYQSWRSRYVDVLEKKYPIERLFEVDPAKFPDAAADSGQAQTGKIQPRPSNGAANRHESQAEEAAPTIEVAEAIGTAQSRREDHEPESTPRQLELIKLVNARQPSDSARNKFSAHEIEHVVRSLEDLPEVPEDDWDRAWEEFAEKVGTHKAEDWKNLYTNHVLIVLQELRWNHHLEDESPDPATCVKATSKGIRSPTQTSTTSQKRKVTQSPAHQPRKAPKRGNNEQATAGSTHGSPLSTPKASQQEYATADEGGPSASPDSQNVSYQREKVDWVFEQALHKKHAEDIASSSGPTTSPSSHRLTAANLLSQARQQDSIHTYDPIDSLEQSIPASQGRDVNGQRAGNVQSGSQLSRAQPQSELPQAAVITHSPRQPRFNNVSFDSALLATGTDLEVVDAELEESSQLSGQMESVDEPDLTFVSPYKSTRVQDSDDVVHAAQLGNRRTGHSASHAMDTQAILNAATQQPDFSFPAPADELTYRTDVRYNTSTPVHKATGSVKGQQKAEPVLIDEDAVETFYKEFGKQGYSDHDITTALHMTSARPDLAEFVLILLRQKKAMPDDVPGIWTAEEDEIALSGNSRSLRKLEERHGADEFLARVSFLYDLADDSQ